MRYTRAPSDPVVFDSSSTPARGSHWDCHGWSPCGKIVASEASEVANRDRKSTRLNSSHVSISYAVFCLKKENRLHADGREDPRHAFARRLRARRNDSHLLVRERAH